MDKYSSCPRWMKPKWSPIDLVSPLMKMFFIYDSVYIILMDVEAVCEAAALCPPLPELYRLRYSTRIPQSNTPKLLWSFRTSNRWQSEGIFPMDQNRRPPYDLFSFTQSCLLSASSIPLRDPAPFSEWSSIVFPFTFRHGDLREGVSYHCFLSR